MDMEECTMQLSGFPHTNREQTMNSTEALILILDLRASRKKNRFVQERVDANLCLGETQDGKQCQCKATKRGLCPRCYGLWYSICLSLGGVNSQKAATYTARLIRLGRILGRNSIGFYKRKSIFNRIA
jgi:hypothetical protein